MANQNGAATGIVDLLSQLVTFLVANGWTSDRSASYGVGGWWATLHKSGLYVHLRAAMNEQPWVNGNGAGYGICFYLGTAYNAGANWNNQSAGAPLDSSGGSPIGVGLPLANSPIANFYFFANGDDIVVAVQKSGGVYGHFGFGPLLNKFGAWTGGAYFFGSASGYEFNLPGVTSPGYALTADCPGTDADANGLAMTFVRADVDAWVSKWISVCDNTFLYACTGKTGVSSCCHTGGSGRVQIPNYGQPQNVPAFQNLQFSAQDGRANLLPVTLYALRDGAGIGYTPLGNIPNIYFCNGVGNGISAGTDYVLGSDTYKLFPNFAVLKT